MQFPFETTTQDGRKATVLGTMPDSRLIGHIKRDDGTFISWDWNEGGSSSVTDMSITLPPQIKPLTTYRMRNGEIAWTSGLVEDGWIHGMDVNGNDWDWRASDGRFGDECEHRLDLIEELPPGTTT